MLAFVDAQCAANTYVVDWKSCGNPPGNHEYNPAGRSRVRI